MKPTLAIPMGDPLGIGPEVAVKALNKDDTHRLCHPLVIGDPGVLRRTVEDLGLPLEIVEVADAGFVGEPGKIFLLAGIFPAGRKRPPAPSPG